MSKKITDAEVWAELERIDPTVLNLWDQYLGVHDDTSRYVRLGPLRVALRLLAESQRELRKLRMEYSKLMDKYCNATKGGK